MHRPMSLREFAKTLHVTERAVRKAIETGRLQQGVERVKGQPVIRDPALAAMEWARNRDPLRESTGLEGLETIATARRRVLEAQAVKVELANAVRRGELLERDEVKQAWAGISLAIREGFLNLSAVALQRGIVSREREPDLQTLVDEILAQLAEARR
jgi:hypothetical protein